MNARRLRDHGGFTFVEVIVSLALATVLLLLFGLILTRGRQATTETTKMLDVDAELRTVLARISEEVRCASRTAEDANGNKILDTGEDRNANGRLEGDWNAAAAALTFNRLQPDGNFSLPITYRVTSGRLQRVTMLTAAGQTTTTVVATGVVSFTVADSAGKVTIGIGIRRTSESGRTINRQGSITVGPRN